MVEPTLEAARKQRKAELVEKMAEMGVNHYEELLHRSKRSNPDAPTIVSSFLDDGYPSLGETVTVLAVAIRGQLLKDVDCWIKDDTRCRAFIEGSIPVSELGRLKVSIRQERIAREASLQAVLAQRGLLLIDHAMEATTSFIKDGVGSAEKIADDAAAEELYKEVSLAFINQGKDMAYWLGQKIRTGDFRGSCDAAFRLVAKFEQDKLSAQTLINEYLAEVCPDLDCKSIRKMYRVYELVQLEPSDGEEGHWDAKPRVAQACFDRKLYEYKLPSRRDLFLKNPSIEERFNTIAHGTSRDLLDFIAALVAERSARALELGCIVGYSGSGKCSQSLAGDARDVVEKSDYVNFGIGTLVESANKCREAYRMKCLERSFEAADSLWAKRIPAAMKADSRLVDFVHGVSRFKTADCLVAVIKEEEKSRRHRMEIILTGRGMMPDDPVAQSLHSKNCNNIQPGVLRKFLVEGTGDPTEVADEVFKWSRERELESQLQDAHIFSPKTMDLPECRDFVNGVSDISCKEFVSIIVDERKNREQAVETLLRSQCLDDYQLRLLSEDYVAGVKKNYHWLLKVAEYMTRSAQARACFGRLKDMLPVHSCEDFSKWAAFLQNETESVIQQKVSFWMGETIVIRDSPNDPPPFDSFAKQISSWIVAYLEPSLSDVARFASDLEGSKSKDVRLWLLLTDPEKCEWENAEQAIAALRSERRSRKHQIDRYLGAEPPQASAMRDPYGCIRMPQDEEDGLWFEHGPRADFINGKITFDEAVVELKKGESRLMLTDALKNAGLHVALLSTNRQCINFIEDEEMEMKLALLPSVIEQLREQRADRCRLLQESFLQSGIVDCGIGIPGSRTGRFGKLLVGDCDNRDQDNATREVVTKRRFKYVDLGEGKPADVVRTTIMYQLLFVEGDSDAWTRAMEKYKALVDVEQGLPSKEEIDSSLSSFPVSIDDKKSAQREIAPRKRSLPE